VDRLLPPRSGFPLEFVDTWLRGARWLLALAETVESVLLIAWHPVAATAAPLAALFLYNAATLWLVHRVPLERLPLAALFFTDLLFVGLAAVFTGATDSPFLGQCYLVIMSAALVYGSSGGLGFALVSILVTVLVGLTKLDGLMEDLRDMLPYFLVCGLLAGFLVDRLQGAVAARLKAEEETRRREVAMEGDRRERELARGMQMAALPAVPAEIPGWRIEALAEFASEVGGDFYLIHPEDGKLLLALGDVCGKGVPAAMAAMGVTHLLPWLGGVADPETAMLRLNRHLSERLPEGSFVTLAMVLLEPATGRASVWSAGHPPLLVRRASGAVEETQASGALLGVFEVWRGESQSLTLEHGDAIVLYSDGMIEARNRHTQLWGTEGLAAEVGEVRTGRAEPVGEQLVHAAREWGRINDDITVLWCERL
jgi:serine phosphatase RsbU (regulator of sigma subunit)